MIRPWKVLALSLFALPCTDALALDRRDDHDIYEDDDYIYPGWYCQECRDPAEHPEDFAAFAYNAYFGEEPWAFGSELGIPFRVYNRELQWVVVWFENFLFNSISFLPDTLNVMIRLETGQIISVTMLQGGPDVPVNDEPESAGTGACSCGGGGGEDDVDEPEDFEEPEIDSDPVGLVEIVDPDDNGDFPEWEREL